MTTSGESRTANAIDHALEDRRKAIKEAASQAVASFRADPENFKPEQAIVLGRAGMRQFLALLGVTPDVVVQEIQDEPPQPAGVANAIGWTHHPADTGHPTINAICGGFGAGSLVIALFAILQSLN